MPPCPSLSARVTNSTYFTVTISVIVHSTMEMMPYTLWGTGATALCSMLNAVGNAYRGLVPMSPNTTPRAPIIIITGHGRRPLPKGAEPSSGPSPSDSAGEPPGASVRGWAGGKMPGWAGCVVSDRGCAVVATGGLWLGESVGPVGLEDSMPPIVCLPARRRYPRMVPVSGRVLRRRAAAVARLARRTASPGHRRASRQLLGRHPGRSGRSGRRLRERGGRIIDGGPHGLPGPTAIATAQLRWADHPEGSDGKQGTGGGAHTSQRQWSHRPATRSGRGHHRADPGHRGLPGRAGSRDGCGARRRWVSAGREGKSDQPESGHCRSGPGPAGRLHHPRLLPHRLVRTVTRGRGESGC